MRNSIVSLALVAIVTPGTSARQPGAYTMIALGPADSWPAAINNGGRIVGLAGNSEQGRNYRALMWTQTGAVTLPPFAGFTDSNAMAINNRGQVVGWSFRGDGSNIGVPTLWEHGVPRSLGLLPQAVAGGAEDINDRGEIVGAVQLYDAWYGEQRAVVWRHGVMTDLGPEFAARWNFSVAWSINNRAQIVGDVCGPDEGCGAFLWDQGTVTLLGSLGGNFARAVAINERADIVGESTTPSGDMHGYLWRRGRMIDLGSVIPLAINNSGEVVGRTNDNHAFFWKDGVTVDLGTLTGACCSRAEDINDRGEIVGTSNGTAGQSEAVLWVPNR